jgi:hypothetical protein
LEFYLLKAPLQNKKGKKMPKISYLLGFLGIFFCWGCAFTNMGSPVAVKGVDAVSEGFSPEEVIQAFGVPDQVYTDDQKTIWVYRYKNGAFFNYLNWYSYGSVGRRDLQIEIRDHKVVRIHNFPAGEAWAFAVLAPAPPGMIAK